MDDSSEPCNKQFRNGLIDSSSYTICGSSKESKGTNGQADLLRSHPLGENIQQSKAGVVHVQTVELRNIQVCPMSAVLRKTVAPTEPQPTDLRISNPIRDSCEPYCHVKWESLKKLKDSTRKLLYLLDNIQSKTYSKDLSPLNPNEITIITSSTVLSAGSQTFPEISAITDVAEPALKYLETQTKALNNIYIKDGDDDCSIFKRLTGKCTCLNRNEYNDFMIHFNEDTKYSTNNSGEIIKNIRILKKFLYMGGTYMKNALMFLNEGLEKSACVERAEITHGCSHSDVCNIFETHSIVITCISWPCRYRGCEDNFTQHLAASFLHKLTQMEEGRRYLKYTSRITNEIKKVLRKRGLKLDEDTKESLQAVVNLLQPSLIPNIYYKFSCRQNAEGSLREIINALQKFRKYMTLTEVFTYLDLLNNFSNAEKDKIDSELSLPSLLLLFKEMLKEYDNSQMNTVITKILSNIISKNMLKHKEEEAAKALKNFVTETATEPIEMKNQIVQMPQDGKHTKKRYNKSKLFLGSRKFCEASRLMDKRNLIVIPVEKKKKKS